MSMTKDFSLFVTESAVRSGLSPRKIANRLDVPFENLHLIQHLSDLDSFVSAPSGLWVNFDHQVDLLTIEKFADLHFVATTSTGIDHLDIEEINKRLIPLVSLDSTDTLLHTISATADLAIGMITGAQTGLLRYLNSSDNNSQMIVTRSRQLSSITLGIVGLGRIGRMVAQRMSAFGTKICYTDLPRKSQTSEQSKEWQKSSLTELLSSSDVISLHANYTPGSVPLLGPSELTIPRGAQILVNTARAGLVHTKSLVEAMYEERIGVYAADFPLHGLDELDFKTLSKIKELQQSGRLFLSPHIGGACEESAAIAEEIIVEKIRKILNVAP